MWTTKELLESKDQYTADEVSDPGELMLEAVEYVPLLIDEVLKLNAIRDARDKVREAARQCPYGKAIEDAERNLAKLIEAL